MEKITQSELIQECKKLGIKINVKGNKNIFKNKIPDGWFIDKKQHNLLIFECKERKDQWKEAKTQLQGYCEIASEYAKSNNLDILPFFCYGTDFVRIYYISDYDDPFKIEFKELYDTHESLKYVFDPHIFNQYIYDNFPNISSDERLKLVVSVLLTKSQNVPLNPPLFQRVLEVERTYGMEEEFKFISSTPYNKCIDKMFEFLEDVPISEIMNVLYSCFVEISKWSFKGIKGSQTKKKLTQDEGAVLTPPHIVDLMVSSLNIKNTDRICDPCCGTGNFLLEALKYTNRIEGNELNLTRYVIAKHGLLIAAHNSNIYFGDCMCVTYKPEFDYLLLNPPYNHHKEQEITLKFVSLSKKGGAVIIPSSNFKDSNFMESLNKICLPLKLIHLNKQVFYPVTDIQTSILIYSKTNAHMKQDIHNDVIQGTCNDVVKDTCADTVKDRHSNLIKDTHDDTVKDRHSNLIKDTHDDRVKDRHSNLIKDTHDDTVKDTHSNLIKDTYDDTVKDRHDVFQDTHEDTLQEYDYVNDGYEIKRQYGRVFKEKREPILINKSEHNLMPIPELVKRLNILHLEQEYQREKKRIKEEDERVEIQKAITTYKITDLFEIMPKSGKHRITDFKDGIYPLISQKAENNGIVKYVDTYNFDGDYITLAPDVGGYCSVQHGKFAVTDLMIVLKPRDEKLNLTVISTIMNMKFKEKYNWQNKLYKKTLQNETIDI